MLNPHLGKYSLTQFHPGLGTTQKHTRAQGNYQIGSCAFISVGGWRKALAINLRCCLIRHNSGVMSLSELSETAQRLESQ